jgi:hypothetical protein
MLAVDGVAFFSLHTTQIRDDDGEKKTEKK